MQKCRGFTDDNLVMINIHSSILWHVEVCAMIQLQAVYVLMTVFASDMGFIWSLFCQPSRPQKIVD